MGIRFSATGPTVVSVRGLNGRSYDILATDNFITWTVVSSVTLGVSGAAEFSYPVDPRVKQRFYRAEQKP